MSVVPLTPPKNFTKTIVIDKAFRVKYKLTASETEIMAYLLMITQSWKELIFVGEYFVILTSKIVKDLMIKTKTIDASISKFKKLGLIETKLVKVEQWESNKNFRGVQITPLGLEYNLSHFKPKVHQEIADLRYENENYRVKNNELELINRVLSLQMETNEEIEKKAIEAIERSEKDREKIALLEKKLEAKNSLEQREAKAIGSKQEEKIDNLKDFRQKTIKEYAQSGKPICNCVKNLDSWASGVIFYINSYSRVSIKIPNGETKQIVEPEMIDRFWSWLHSNQHRVGEIIDTTKAPDISLLLAFLGKSIELRDTVYTIERLKPTIGGVKVWLKDREGNLISIGNGFGSEVIDKQSCMRWFESALINL